MNVTPWAAAHGARDTDSCSPSSSRDAQVAEADAGALAELVLDQASHSGRQSCITSSGLGARSSSSVIVRPANADPGGHGKRHRVAGENGS